MGRREALSRASVPCPETAPRIARLRLLNKVLHGPAVLLALLQSAAGLEWKQMTKDDLANLNLILPRPLLELPSPADHPAPWLSLIYDTPGTVEATAEAIS